MNALNWIRTNTNRYVTLNEIKPIEAIYIPTEALNQELTGFITQFHAAQIYLEGDLFSEENKKVVETIKKYFNPLLITQHILLLSKDGESVYEVPFLFSQIYDDAEKIHSIRTVLNAGESLKNLLLYQITKDLLFLNRVGEIHVGLFGKAKRFLNDINIQEAEKLVNAFCSDKRASENLLQIKLSELKRAQKPDIQQSSAKNLVLIHLESISNLILNTNKHLLPELTALIDRSLNFTRFYSSATSTIMSVASVFHGNDFEVDAVEEYNDVFLDTPYNQNVFQTLREHGYETEAIAAYNQSLTDMMKDGNIWNDGKTQYNPCYSHADFIESLKKFIDKNGKNKFALFLDNKYTHCGISDEMIGKALTFESKMELSFVSLNETIKSLLESLAQHNLMEDTVIIAYGDHGDDKWTRTLNYGFSHSTEPYTSITNTPFFIYDQRIKPGISTVLVSSIDVKYILLYLLNIENEDVFPFSGKNVLMEKNTEVYSQNLFLRQSTSEKIGNLNSIKLNQFHNIEQKNKAFSILNESFCLVVSQKGMEFFNIVSDPLCYNNLLRFYEFDQNGYAIRFKNYNAWRGHFRIEIMDDVQIYHCLKNFYSLRALLRERILAKSEQIEGIAGDLFDMSGFDKINGSVSYE